MDWDTVTGGAAANNLALAQIVLGRGSDAIASATSATLRDGRQPHLPADAGLRLPGRR